jgi:hypothetical protein
MCVRACQSHQFPRVSHVFVRKKIAGPKPLVNGALSEPSGPGAIAGTIRAFDTMISGYQPRCGRAMVGVAPNPLARDVSHALFSSAVQFEDSSPELAFSGSNWPWDEGPVRGLATCTPPQRCDADGHRLVIDSDGTLRGHGTRGAEGSYFSMYVPNVWGLRSQAVLDFALPPAPRSRIVCLCLRPSRTSPRLPLSLAPLPLCRPNGTTSTVDASSPAGVMLQAAFNISRWQSGIGR